MSKKVTIEIELDESEVRVLAERWGTTGGLIGKLPTKCCEWVAANQKKNRAEILGLPWSPGVLRHGEMTIVGANDYVYGWFTGKEQRDLALAAPKMAAAIAEYKHARRGSPLDCIDRARSEMFVALKGSGWEDFDG